MALHLTLHKFYFIGFKLMGCCAKRSLVRPRGVHPSTININAMCNIVNLKLNLKLFRFTYNWEDYIGISLVMSNVHFAIRVHMSMPVMH